GDAVALVADSTRLRRRLGWQPQYDDLDGIVRSALVWERSQLGKG
ncbi:MAG TPA: UDP-glucose 4-epimerase GalE, partial [Alphaproteobacteria bacterium]|nr:UDP-glucose 4-epimerase GalE [Alphaproteobacteria bacterium]